MGLDVLGLKVKRRTIQDVTFTEADPGSSKKPWGEELKPIALSVEKSK
jgi:hypothetical protein